MRMRIIKKSAADAAIVNNKVLGAALQYDGELQQQRDDKKLKSGSLAKRDKRLLGARQQAAALWA